MDTGPLTSGGSGETNKIMSIPNTAEEAIAWLDSPKVEEIAIDRIPAVAASADPDVAQRLARELADRPKYFAKHGPKSIMISHEAFLALKNRGAKCPKDL